MVHAHKTISERGAVGYVGKAPIRSLDLLESAAYRKNISLDQRITYT